MASDSTIQNQQSTDAVTETPAQKQQWLKTNFENFEAARAASLTESTAQGYVPPAAVGTADIKADANHDADKVVKDLVDSHFLGASQDWHSSISGFDNSDPSAHDRSVFDHSLNHSISSDVQKALSGSNSSATGEGTVAQAASGSNTVTTGEATVAQAGSGSNTVTTGEGTVAQAASAGNTVTTGEAAVAQAASASNTATTGEATVAQAASASNTATTGEATVAQAASAGNTATTGEATVAQAASPATTASDTGISAASATAASAGSDAAATPGTATGAAAAPPDFVVTSQVIHEAATQDAQQLVSDLQSGGMQTASQDFNKDITSFNNVDPSAYDRQQYSAQLGSQLSQQLEAALQSNSSTGTGSGSSAGGDGSAGGSSSGSGTGSGSSAGGDGSAGGSSSGSGTGSGSSAGGDGSAGGSSSGSGTGSGSSAGGDGSSGGSSGGTGSGSNAGGGDGTGGGSSGGSGGGTPNTEAGLFINGQKTGMQTVFNMSGATNLGAFKDIAGIVASNGWNPSNGAGGVDAALATKDNGTFSVTLANPWNENGHQGSYTEQIPIPDEGLAALEASAKQTNSDGHVLIEDTQNNTYYDFWLGQNIASGNNSGKAETLVQGSLSGNGTPGSTAAGVTEAYADTSVSAGLHPLLFDLPTNMMHPGNGGMVQGSTNSDVTSGSTGVQEGDIATLTSAQADKILADNPNLTEAQKMIIEDAVPVDQGGGGGWIIADQAGTGWSGDENFGIWQMQQNSVDLTFMNHLNGGDPNAVLDQLNVYTHD